MDLDLHDLGFWVELVFDFFLDFCLGEGEGLEFLGRLRSEETKGVPW